MPTSRLRVCVPWLPAFVRCRLFVDGVEAGLGQWLDVPSGRIHVRMPFDLSLPNGHGAGAVDCRIPVPDGASVELSLPAVMLNQGSTTDVSFA